MKIIKMLKDWRAFHTDPGFRVKVTRQTSKAKNLKVLAMVFAIRNMIWH